MEPGTTRKNHRTSTNKRRTRRLLRKQAQKGGALKSIVEWVDELNKHPAYRANKDSEFQGADYDMKLLIESMKNSNLTISPHDSNRSNQDADDLHVIDSNNFEKPSYLYDVGTILAYIIGNSVSPGITPTRFLARINAMKKPDGNDAQLQYDAELSYGPSLAYMTSVENALRKAAKKQDNDDPNILSNPEKYPLYIWAVVINLPQEDKGNGVTGPPDPKVPALLTTTEEQSEKSERQGAPVQQVQS
jgi:hypothetical protein